MSVEQLPAASRLALTLDNQATPVRFFRIHYGWKQGGRRFSANTVWGVRGDGRKALNDFTRRNPHVCSACVTGEVQ